jgi:integrase
MASIAKRPDGHWRARYRDEAGREHARHFSRKVDAQRWLDEVASSVVTGTYVDPRAGRMTFKEYAEHWRSIQVHRPTTAEVVERVLRRRVYPVIGDRPLGSIRPSEIQALVKSWDVAPATAEVTYSYVATIFKAAVLDQRVAKSPCQSIKLPEVVKDRVVPMTTDEVQVIVEAMPERYWAMVILAAGTGMRQGEVFGLTLEQIRFLEREVVVDRQLVAVSGRAPIFGPPKTSSSRRTIPLPNVVVEALARHVHLFPPAEGEPIFTGSEGQSLRRSAFGEVWRKGTRAAGVRRVTFHALRHYYASLLIRHGESVKVVQSRLGHKSADETLNTYAHLWPDADDRTRDAVDSQLGTPADSLRTAT